MTKAGRHHRIAVMPGDGIGKEVMPEGVRVLEAAAKRHGIDLEARLVRLLLLRILREARPHDAGGLEGRRSAGHDAIFFGAVGMPDKVPDHVSLWGSLLLFRREFDQYINLRPVRLMPGVPCPLVGREARRHRLLGRPREHRGRVFLGRRPHLPGHRARGRRCRNRSSRRIGGDRVLRYAFELAEDAGRRSTSPSATKSNGISITMPYWDERVEAMAEEYPEVAMGQVPHRHPDGAFRAATRTGSTWWSPPTSSATSCRTSGPPAPARSASRPRATSTRSGHFRPCSSRSTARRPTSPGKGIANPIGQIWSGAMMLEHLGEAEAAAGIVAAIERVLAERGPGPATSAAPPTRSACGKAVADAVG